METGFEVAYQAFNACLARLGVAHVDMLLIHWPGKAKVATDSPENRRARKQTWEALERIHQEGRARFIGVSNFTETHLTQLFEDGVRIKPYANQVEVHVLLQQRSLREFCKSHGILLQCYSPLGSGGAPVIGALQGKVENPLKYALHAARHLSDSVVVKSAKSQRIIENKELLTSSEDECAQDLEKLKSFNQNVHFCWNPQVVA